MKRHLLLPIAFALPLALSSCKLLQLPANLVRTVTGGIVENTPATTAGDENSASRVEIAIKAGREARENSTAAAAE